MRPAAGDSFWGDMGSIQRERQPSMQREDQTDHGNGPGTNSSESAVNHLSKSVVRDTEGAAKQNPHATFCGNRGRATAPGDPVAGVQFPCATRPARIVRARRKKLERGRLPSAMG